MDFDRGPVKTGYVRLSINVDGMTITDPSNSIAAFTACRHTAM